MEDNIIMIPGNLFKQMMTDAAYEGARKALAEIGTNNTMPKERLSLKDAASYISTKTGVGMSHDHLKKLGYKGEIRYSKINGKLSFLPQDLDSWIEQHAQSSDRSLEDAAREIAKSARRKRTVKIA